METVASRVLTNAELIRLRIRPSRLRTCGFVLIRTAVLDRESMGQARIIEGRDYRFGLCR